jgi:hypothetical protein
MPAQQESRPRRGRDERYDAIWSTVWKKDSHECENHLRNEIAAFASFDPAGHGASAIQLHEQ